MSEQEMRGEILALVRAYCEKYHAPKEDFSPGIVCRMRRASTIMRRWRILSRVRLSSG